MEAILKFIHIKESLIAEVDKVLKTDFKLNSKIAYLERRKLQSLNRIEKLLEDLKC